MTEDVIQVTPTLAIPRSELVFKATRSGGAGGQHVNTSSTRIELLWDFRSSGALSDAQKARIGDKLGARIDADGFVRVVSANRRSQLQNRVAAEARLAELIGEAMYVAPRRKKTKPSKASKEKRLQSKKKQSEKKSNRRRDFD
jgi:ribosome-associated protein